MITLEEITKYISYNPDTGDLVKLIKTSKRCKLGVPLGTVNRGGYLQFKLLGTHYSNHRVAWFIHHGRWPSYDIDHVSGDPSDNRISNLRDVPHSENQKNIKKSKNNSSGFIGVRWCKLSLKWRASICVDGTQINLGFFSDKTHAIAARAQANKKYGFHENHGRD